MPAVHIATPDGQRAVYDENEAREKVASGRLPPGSVFWMQGMAEWKPVSKLAETLANYRPPASEVDSGPPSVGDFSGAPRTSELAIASLVLGVLSFVLNILTALPAIVCGHVALRKIKRSNGFVAGQGFAMTGLFFGYFFTLFAAIIGLWLLVMYEKWRIYDNKHLVDASNI